MGLLSGLAILIATFCLIVFLIDGDYLGASISILLIILSFWGFIHTYNTQEKRIEELEDAFVKKRVRFRTK